MLLLVRERVLRLLTETQTGQRRLGRQAGYILHPSLKEPEATVCDGDFHSDVRVGLLISMENSTGPLTIKNKMSTFQLIAEGKSQHNSVLGKNKMKRNRKMKGP